MEHNLLKIIGDIEVCTVQILKCFRSKYLLFFSAHRDFRHVGIDVRLRDIIIRV
jgi:hypothetical protein